MDRYNVKIYFNYGLQSRDPGKCPKISPGIVIFFPGISWKMVFLVFSVLQRNIVIRRESPSPSK